MNDGDGRMKTPAAGAAAGVLCVQLYLPVSQRAYSLLLMRPSRL